MIWVRKLIEFIFIFNSFICSSQIIDNNLSSIEIQERNMRSFGFNFNKPKKDNDIVLVETSICQIYESKLIVGKLNKIIRYFSYPYPDTCSYFMDGTKMLLVGLSDYDRIRSGEVKKCVSFRIKDMPEIGDSAKFDFKFLSMIKNKGLSPEVYFSKNIYVNQHSLKIKNFKKFIKYKDTITTNKNGEIENIRVSFLITKEASKYSWIHLIFPFQKADAGFILPMNLKFKNLDSLVSQVEIQNDIYRKQKYELISEFLFDINSFDISPNNKKKLDSLVIEWKVKMPKYISVFGFTDRTGNIEYNLTLAFNRANSIKNYLLENGIPDYIIEIKQPSIVYDEEVDKNRKCLVKYNGDG